MAPRQARSALAAQLDQKPATTPGTTRLRVVDSEPEELRVIEEGFQNHVQFNVMPGRGVEETLTAKEYRIGKRYIEATFDREYKSDMDKSPSHLIFITALVHTQKLLYALLCDEFGVDYDPTASESIKIWPTSLQIELPRMIRKERDIVQRLWVTELEKRSETEYRLTLVSQVETQVAFRVECAIYRI